MARAVDSRSLKPQAEGYDMVAGARKSYPNGASAARGTYMVGAVGDATAEIAQSPGASLGTGSNLDLYHPAVEAV
jgi:hypothetical protein